MPSNPSGFDPDQQNPLAPPGTLHAAPLNVGAAGALATAQRMMAKHPQLVKAQAAGKGPITLFRLDTSRSQQILGYDDDRMFALLFNEDANNVIIGSQSQCDDGIGFPILPNTWPGFTWPAVAPVWAIGTQAAVQGAGQKLYVVNFTFSGAGGVTG